MCNKSRGYAGHITGARAAFQTAHTYKHCYYNYSNEQSCQPNICEDTTKYALTSLSNFGIKQIKVIERCMWQYNKTSILHF